MKMTSQRHSRYLSNLDNNVTLVFRKPSWQLRASLASVLITPVLYQLYLIMVTIRYILFLQTFSSPPRPACPVVDLSWTGVFPCELGWRGSALAVLILSAVLITCYSLITACLVRWNPRKQWNIQYCTTSVFDTQEKPTQFQVRVQSTNRPPTLSLYILLLIFRLLLQSGDVEANPGPTFTSILTLDDLNSVYKNLIKAAGNWFNLGLDLGLGFDILNNIKYEHRDNQTYLCDMIAARLKTGPLTYSEICQSLRSPTVEQNDVAEAIEEAFTDGNTSPGPSKRQKLCAIETYKTYLTSTYNVRQLPADERCPLGCVKRFINLKIVDNNHDRSEFQKHEVCGKIDRVDKGLVSIEQIACKIDDSLPKLVIIEGAPGVGKTTLSWELCRRWSLGKIWRDYDLVVLLQLHDKSTHEANNLVDLFECGDEATSQGVREELHITHCKGKKLLFILEGLDKFPQELRKTKDSCIIMKLIHGKLLPASTVVVTSRPWALDSLKKCSSRIDQKVVVLGFTEKQIQEYIDQAIKDGAPDGLQTYIDANPHINSAMYNPLCARIVIQVYIECHQKENNDFPNTTTELYMAYSCVLIKRYLADHSVEEKWNGNLQELPQSLQPHFSHLCRIAHKGLVENKNQVRAIFDDKDIPKDSPTLGFMNSVPPLQSVTQPASTSYNFLHLTLQEFLAAFHVWRTYQHKQQLLFMETQSSMINLFLAGLTKLSDPWIKCVLPTPRVRSSDNERVVYLNRQHILWLYETQNEQLISSFKNVVLPITLQSGLDPLYFLALGYCIAVGKFMLEIKIRFENDEIDKNHLHFLAGLKRHNSEFSSQIKVLDILWGEKPFPDSLYELFNYVPHTTQGVLHFYNGGHNSLAERLSECVKLVKYVKYVKLFNTEIVTTSLLNKVSNYFETLKTLHCHIDDSKIAGELNDTILEFYMSLEYVEVRVAIRVDGSDDESQYLLFGLNMIKFKELNRPKLFPSNFGPIFIEELTQYDFTEQANKFTDHFADFLIYFGLFTGSSQLSTFIIKRLVCHSLSKCPLLEKLTIDFISPDPIAASGQDLTLQNLDSIFTALKENSSVKELSCKIKVDCTSNQIIDHFCAQLRQTISLEEIDLEVLNRLNNPKLEQIMETVCRPTLKKFVIRINFHSPPVIANNDTIVAICNVLENNENLEYLHLPTMRVEPHQRFLLPIANALSMNKNSSLTTLILEFKPTKKSSELYCNITSKDTKAVGDMLKENTTLRVLHLMVDIPDWSPIIEGLKFNTTIRELHIPSSAKESAIKCIGYDHVIIRSRIKYPKQYI